MTLTQKTFLTIIFLFGFFVRLYKINNPIADWHSHRQADTASVTNNFLSSGIDLFRPTYHDLSNIQSGIDNPYGYRFVEFPIYNLLSYFSAKIFPFTPEISYRLTSILLSLISAWLVFLITKKLTSNVTPAIISSFIFLSLPFNIYYSRAILPEPLAILLMLASLYFFLNLNFFTATTSLALGLTIKPYIGLILFPIILTIIAIHPKIFFQKNKIIYHVLLLSTSLLPFLLWRKWMLNFPEGIPANNWLLNNNNASTFPDWYHGYHIGFLNKIVAFRPYWFNWLFSERLARLILGSFGLIPFFLGLALQAKNLQKYLLSLIAGILLYFVIIAGGNIQHDYYQSLISPFISIITGLGYYYIFKFLFKNKIFATLSALTIFSLSTYFSANLIKEYYNINNPNIITAGQTADKLLPKNALVIAPYNGDTAFLYQIHRSGWPLEIYDLDSLKSKHPKNPIYLVSINNDTYTNNLVQKYPSLTKTNQLIILEITK